MNSHFPPKPQTRTPLQRSNNNNDQLNKLALDLQKELLSDNFNIIVNYLHDDICRIIDNTCLYIQNSSTSDVYNYALGILIESIGTYDAKCSNFYTYYYSNLHRRLHTYLSIDNGYKDIKTISPKYVNRRGKQTRAFNSCIRLDSLIDTHDDNERSVIESLVFTDKDRVYYESIDWFNEAIKIVNAYLSPYEQEALSYYLSTMSKKRDKRPFKNEPEISFKPLIAANKDKKTCCKALDNAMCRIKQKLLTNKADILASLNSL